MPCLSGSSVLTVVAAAMLLTEASSDPVIIPRRQPDPEPEPNWVEKFGNQIAAGLAIAAATSIVSNMMMLVSVPEKLKALGDRVEVLVGEMRGYREEIREVNKEMHMIKLDVNTLKLKD